MIAKIEKILFMRPYVILMLLVVLAFANSIGNSFLFDDHGLIIGNPKIDLPIKEMPSIFITPLWKMAGFAESRQGYYRPLVSLLFILDYKIWGLNPVGFHLTNIFLHIIAVAVLYKIGLLLFNKDENAKLISLMAASVFAIHPVHNETVGRVASGDVIFGFFLIISLYFFLKERKYLSWIAFSLALLSKETAVMLPFALVILSIDKKGLKKGLIAIIPYMILIGIYLVLRAMFVDTLFGDKVNQPIFTRILTMAVATLDYIKLLLIPYPLRPHYPAQWYASILEPKVMLAMVVLILISYLAFKIRKDKTMAFLFVLPFLMIAPVIWRVNVLTTGEESVYIAERFLYVPAMLFPLFVSAYAVRLAGEKAKKYAVIGWILITTILTGITVITNTLWKDDCALFTKIVQESPDVAFAHHNLGAAYFELGRIDEAILEFKTSLRLTPSIMAHKNLGLIYYSQGKMNEAREEFNAALMPPLDAHKFDNVHSKHQDKLKQADLNNNLWSYQPYFADVHFNLGRVYLAQGDIDKAMRKFKVAAILRPDFAEAHYSLGNIYQKQGKLDEAVKEYQAVLKLDPNHAYARNKLGSLYK